MERSFSALPHAMRDSVEPDPSAKDRQAKKGRHRHSAVQLAALNELYEKTEHPSLDQRTNLAKKLGMETKTVNAWFQNKRASTKKRQLQSQTKSQSSKKGNAVGLPPISTLLASAPSPPSSSFPTPSRSIRRSARQPYDYEEYPEDDERTRLPPIEYYENHQSSFFAGAPMDRKFTEPHVETNMPKKMRFRPTPQQTEELKKLYLVNPHPSKEEREDLGDRIGMRYQSVTNWFQNQRSLAKKRREEEGDAHSSDTRPSPVPQRTRNSSPSAYSAFPPASSHPSLIFSVPPSTSMHPLLRASPASSPRLVPYPLHGDVRNRSRRSRPEPFQLEKLEKLARRTSNPSIEERSALAFEINMELTKVTNWFRNLRQSARRRAAKMGDDYLDEDDGDSASMNNTNPSSTSASRMGSPSIYGDESSFTSLSAPSVIEQKPTFFDLNQPRDYALQIYQGPGKPEVSSPSVDYVEPMQTDEDESPEEEYQEVLTPSPSPPPAVSRPRIDPYVRAWMESPEDDHAPRSMAMTARMQAPIIGHAPGVTMEDALLLVHFQQQPIKFA